MYNEIEKKKQEHVISAFNLEFSLKERESLTHPSTVKYSTSIIKNMLYQKYFTFSTKIILEQCMELCWKLSQIDVSKRVPTLCSVLHFFLFFFFGVLITNLNRRYHRHLLRVIDAMTSVLRIHADFLSIIYAQNNSKHFID